MNLNTLRLLLDPSQYLASLRTAGAAGQRFAADLSGHMRTAEGSFDRLRVSALGVGGALAGLGVGRGLQSIVETGNAFTRMQNTMLAATGDMGAAKAEMAAIGEYANKMGLEVLGTTEAYAKMAAAARGTSLEGQKARDIFQGIGVGLAALQPSAEDAAGALKAVEQMISKGKVQAEELRGQLGDRLPGAFQLAAKAMGMTTAELDKAMKDGKVYSEDFLPKFAEAVKQHYGQAAEQGAKSLQAAMNRSKNAWNELKNAVSEGGFAAALNEELSRLNEAFKDGDFKAAARSIGDALGDAVRMVGDAVRWLAAHAEEVKAVLVGLGSALGALALARTTGAVLSLAAAFGPLGLAIAGAAGTMYYYRESAVEMESSTVQLQDVVVGTWEVMKRDVSASVSQIGDWISSTFSDILTFVGNTMANLPKIMAGAVAAVSAGAREIMAIFTALWADIQNGWAWVGTSMRHAMAGNWESASQSLSNAMAGGNLTKAASGTGERIGKAFSEGFNNGPTWGSLVGEPFKNKVREIELEATANSIRRSTSTLKPNTDALDANSKAAHANAAATAAAAGGHDKLAEKAAEAMSSMRRQVEEAQRLYDARKEGEASYDKMKDLIQGENAALSGGISLSSAAGQEMLQLALKKGELERATQKLIEAEREQARATEKAAEEAKRAKETLSENLFRESKDVLTPTAFALAELDRWKSEQHELLKKAGLDWDEYSGKIQTIFDAKLKKIWDDDLKRAKDWGSGMKRALQDYAESATDAAKNAEDLFTNSFKSMEDALVEFVKTGKLDFKSLADSIVADIARITIRQSITGPLAQMMGGAMGGGGGGGMGSMFSGIGSWIGGLFGFANGGVMTSGGSVPLHAYSNGGVANSPQLALYGEGRKPEAYVPLPDGRTIPVTMSGNSNDNGARQIVVNFSVQATDADSFGKSRGQIEADLRGMVNRAARNA
ncbi:tape measure protein [Azospirillum brasilense]|uniref:tape measure protein n=1 Tax=Azospirillum brasilense TaxID=192 RepID=UPI00157AF7FE|nr:tape measure protein [Azospirillum brasilense]NUB24708.1 tape measure protein [Azospirillum brasilense]